MTRIDADTFPRQYVRKTDPLQHAPDQAKLADALDLFAAALESVVHNIRLLAWRELELINNRLFPYPKRLCSLWGWLPAGFHGLRFLLFAFTRVISGQTLGDRMQLCRAGFFVSFALTKLREKQISHGKTD